MMMVVMGMVLVGVAGGGDIDGDSGDAGDVSGVGGDGGGITNMMITNHYHYQLYHILLHCVNKFKVGSLYNNLPFTTL